MWQYSDSFVLSQYNYYLKHLGSGNFHIKNMICGLLQSYEAECKRRNLL